MSSFFHMETWVVVERQRVDRQVSNGGWLWRVPDTMNKGSIQRSSQRCSQVNSQGSRQRRVEVIHSWSLEVTSTNSESKVAEHWNPGIENELRNWNPGQETTKSSS
ncbi:hypothetical protein AMECASPLE_005476 [Ameca splendens]|uniref:Uncharacterized protein n=1 Tax=Ameca splendens TaxID=208324 RepID=A0ABV0ZJ69_9TELE